MMYRSTMFLTLMFTTLLLPALNGQTDKKKVATSDLVVAKDLKLTFRLPKEAGSAIRTESRLRGGEKMTQFLAQKSDGFRAELSFVHGQRKLEEIEIWKQLQRLVENTIKTSRATLTHATPCWVDSFPGFRYAATIKKSESVAVKVEGQFLLTPDSIIFAQTAGINDNLNRAAVSREFFASVRRPNVPRPKKYKVQFGNIVLEHPAGVFPRSQDGILQLEDLNGQFGLLLHLEDSTMLGKGEIICALAQSLDQLTSRDHVHVSLLQGPGKIASQDERPSALGYSSLVSRNLKKPEEASKEYVFVRFYDVGKRRLFVSAYAKSPAKGATENSPKTVVERIMQSIKSTP